MAELIADPFRAARLVLALRQNGITNSAVLKAMETINRASFAPDSLADLAFENTHIPIACGQSIPPPAVIGQLLEALAFDDTPGGRTLLVGAGSGYTAALLATLSQHVVAVERYKTLADSARERLAEMSLSNVDIHHGDGLRGMGEYGPYDRILLTGMVDEVPPGLREALTRDGRGVAPSMRDSIAIMQVFPATVVRHNEPELLAELAPLREGVAKVL